MEIITQWPGHASEEVERLISIPLEVEMNGIPKIESLRSISLYGLSALEMNFQYEMDPYFAREQAFERMANATLPDGVTPGVSPLFSPSGLIYRYVLVSPDRTPQELKTIEAWVLERKYRSIPGVADDSGLGGTTMQYQVLLNPYRLFSRGVTVPQVFQQLGSNNSNAGGGFYSQGGQFYYIRGLGLVKTTEDIGNVVVSTNNGIPTYVHDVGKVEIGYAPRLGQFGFMNQDDAVEGVILMRVGEQAQVVLKQVQQMTKELNDHVLPPDVKILPYYDRSELIEETTRTVERNLIRGMVLVLIVLGIFLLSVRAAMIVSLTIPFALMFAFICLDWRHIPANLLSIGAIDFGILVDGAVVMVENVFRELAARHGEEYNLIDVIRAAAHDVERPIFYAVAVIIAGYLPIYALQGPSGRLFQPMADTMSFALLGSLICALIVLPVLCSYLLRGKMQEPRARVFEFIRSGYGALLGWCLRNRTVSIVILLGDFRGIAAADPADRRGVHAASGRGRVVDARHRSLHHLLRRSHQAVAADSQYSAQFPAGHHGGERTGPPGRRHRSHRLFQQRVLHRAEALRATARGRDRFTIRRQLIDAIQQKDVGLSRRDFQLHAARRGRGG